MTRNNFRILAAWCAIISLFFAFATILFSLVTLNFDIALFIDGVSENAAVALPVLVENPTLIWWPIIFDFAGFYLLLLPLIIYLYRLFKNEAPDWMKLFTVCGLGYILFGAMGAATLAFVLSGQAAAYASASSTTQQLHLIVFEAFSDFIQRGVWGLLDPVLAGIWWTGLGLLLRRYRIVLGWYTLLLGLINLFGGLSAAIRLEAIATICLNLYFLMAPIWAGWMGVILLQKNKKPGTWPSPIPET